MKVAGHPALIKTREGVVINTDRDAYEAYIKNRNSKQELENRVAGLENKMDLILQLLQERK